MTDECGARGDKGFCCLVEDKVSVGGRARRGDVLGRERAPSRSPDVGRIEQRLSGLGSDVEMLRGKNGEPEGGWEPSGLVCAGPSARCEMP